MSRVVWKFPVSPVTEMPGGAKIIAHDAPMNSLWVECDPQATVKTRRFAVIGTGREVPEGASHVNTWVEGSFVWHLYALPEGA